jgi:hypothetical protein
LSHSWTLWVKTLCFLVHGAKKTSSEAQTRARNGHLKLNNFVVYLRETPNIGRRVCAQSKLPIGEFARIEIIGRIDYDLIAEPI